MTEEPKRILEKILARNPDLFIEDPRKLSEDLFLLIGKALVRDLDEIYLTSHTVEYFDYALFPKDHSSDPIDLSVEKDCSNSYRLWISKPPICRDSGHPDWLPNIGIIQTNKKMHPSEVFFYDKEILSKLIGENTLIVPEPKIVYTPQSNHCKESRIYKIKFEN